LIAAPPSCEYDQRDEIFARGLMRLMEFKNLTSQITKGIVPFGASTGSEMTPACSKDSPTSDVGNGAYLDHETRTWIKDEDGMRDREMRE